MFAQATVMGHIGRDAESRQAGTTTVNTFTVATNRRVKDEDTTTWWRVNAWGDRWNGVLPYLKKGTAVLVNGPVVLREYEASDGSTRTSLEINANEITLLPRSAATTEVAKDDDWGDVDF